MSIGFLNKPYSFADDQVGLLAKSDDGKAYKICVDVDFLDDHIIDTPIESEGEEKRKLRYFAACDQNRGLIETIAKRKFDRGIFHHREIRINPGDDI